jgi:hypothetical protein
MIIPKPTIKSNTLSSYKNLEIISKALSLKVRRNVATILIRQIKNLIIFYLKNLIFFKLQIVQNFYWSNLTTVL